jgi:nucleotide-binding universal stress UspA family protein
VQHNSDVILLGHRKSRNGQRSLARRLAMIAPCSVWLVPEGSPDRLSRILVPVDFSSHSADALGLATSLAARSGHKECLALHVYFDPSMVRYDEHVGEVLGHERAAFETMLAAIDCHGVSVEPVFEESTKASQAILRVSHERNCDLIVMNTRGRSRSAAVLLGSVTSETMAATTVPLLAVKHFGSRMTLMQALLNHRFWEEPAPKSN